MDLAGDPPARKGITIDAVEVVLIAVMVCGILCSIARPDGFSLISVHVGRYDLLFFSATALVAYRAVMRITR